MFLVNPPLSGKHDRALADILHDLSKEKPLDALVESLVTGILEYESDQDPASKRRKWCLATIHTRDELAEHIRHQLVGSGVPFANGEGEFITGRRNVTVYEASLLDAWFGIHPGLGGIPAEKVDWGDTVEDYSFASEWAAKQFAESLDEDAIATSWYRGSDGRWHVTIVHDNPYN
jgi:hypothetical protein